MPNLIQRVFSLQKKELPKNVNKPVIWSSIFLRNLFTTSFYDRNVYTYIDQGYKNNPIVYALVEMIAKAGSRARWEVVDRNTGKPVDIPLLSVESNGHQPLIHRPNVMQSMSAFIREFFTQYFLTGNAFLTGEVGSGINRDKITSMFWLPSANTEIKVNKNQRRIDWYRVNQHTRTYGSIEIPAQMVCHIKTPNPDYRQITGLLFGQSPFEACSKSIQTVNESIEMGIWILKNKGATKILFPDTVEGGIDQEQADQLKKRLEQTAQGIENVGQLPLSSLKLGALDLTTSVKETLMMDQRIKAEVEICNVIGVPPQLIGHNVSGMYGEKEAKKLMWDNVIIPTLQELEEGFNRWLAPTYGDDLKMQFDIKHIDALQEGKLLLGRAIKEMSGFVTINEARKWIGLAPLPGERGEELLNSSHLPGNTDKLNSLPDTNRPEFYTDEYNDTQPPGMRNNE